MFLWDIFAFIQKVFCQLSHDGKIMPGSRLQVEVDERANSREIRDACFAKQSSYNHHLMLSRRKEDFNLLYKSYEPAEFLPGTSDDLVLQKYKQAIGLPYASITFLLNWLGIGEWISCEIACLCTGFCCCSTPTGHLGCDKNMLVRWQNTLMSHA